MVPVSTVLKVEERSILSHTHSCYDWEEHPVEEEALQLTAAAVAAAAADTRKRRILSHIHSWCDWEDHSWHPDEV
jgi:hypothetical protein